MTLTIYFSICFTFVSEKLKNYGIANGRKLFEVPIFPYQ